MRTAVALLLTATATASLVAGAQPGRQRIGLDAAMAAYAGGDRGSIERAFTDSLDFQAARLTDRRRLRRFLRPWEPARARFLLELAHRASEVAPAYTAPLLAAGREYLTTRPPGSDAAATATFDRLWHQAAIGMLQRRRMVDATEAYAGAVLTSPAGRDPALRARLLLALGVAQEHRCWMLRPLLVRAGTPVHELTAIARARAGRSAARRPASTDVGALLACVDDAAARFAAVPDLDAAALAEARVRLAWSQFQLGLSAEARLSLERAGSLAAADHDLRYLAALFRGRIAAAGQRMADAERAYREALEICPGAQAAGVGLALALFATDRVDEARAVAEAVRHGADEIADPWWAYLAGDSRFVAGWIDQLRAQP